MKPLAPILALALAGCVVGQNIRLHYEAPAAEAATYGPVTVTVIEQREYVTSGNKQPWYLGHYRGGFGNTWDVVNFQRVPLADQIKSDLQSELRSLGFTEGAGKALQVTIHEWNFDAMMNGRVWYDIEASVIAATGAPPLVTVRVKDERAIEGNWFTGVKGAMEEQVPAVYAEAIRKLVRDNPAVLAALR